MVAEMRQHGVATPIRSVTVKQWDKGVQLFEAPFMFEASYFDAEQGLTEWDVYAARVHDWHARTGRDNQVADLEPRDYLLWSEDWGPQPASCSKCAAALTPQN